MTSNIHAFSIDLIVFDLDGTLVDTKDDIVAAFEWTLDQYEISPPEKAQIEGLVGTGVQDYLRELFRPTYPDPL